MLKNSRVQTPDEEEWCCPGRKRITRWRRRFEPRPACHHLAEDDEDEQALVGLNHLVSRNGGAQDVKESHRCS